MTNEHGKNISLMYTIIGISFCYLKEQNITNTKGWKGGDR